MSAKRRKLVKRKVSGTEHFRKLFNSLWKLEKEEEVSHERFQAFLDAFLVDDDADEIRMKDGKPEFLSNNAGGILGGISTGQDVVCRFAVKPTSSILTPRRTVDANGNETDIVTKGRHDPCVGIRAVPVGEAMMAIVLADHFLRHRGQIG